MLKPGGANESRTRDLLHAMQARYQLRYSPNNNIITIIVLTYENLNLTNYLVDNLKYDLDKFDLDKFVKLYFVLKILKIKFVIFIKKISKSYTYLYINFYISYFNRLFNIIMINLL